MIWYPRSSLLITLLLLFVNHRSGQGSKTAPNDYPLPRPAVFCDKHNATILELPAVPVPVSVVVDFIDYKEQLLSVSDPDNCLPRLFLKFYNLPVSPFQFESVYAVGETWNNKTFFGCSSTWPRQLRGNLDKISNYYDYQQLDINSCPILAVSSEQSIVECDLLSCAKMFGVTLPITAYDLRDGLLNLSWRKPDYGFKYVDWKHKATKITIPIISATTGGPCMFLLSHQASSSPFLSLDFRV